ncbi:hypothetical protein DPMN_173310 [Dreissena polymorpha]|uniref:Uncharacterized protein n=1 Tax=Dreissena polymorpha TaxID=45954 RepID=A0A9D4IFZ1_DREPO|nr:hypothetical protein DPMN_173310 [Dreissena polymorpha]
MFAEFKDVQPVLCSRLRRFVYMLLVPVLLFANEFMYRNGIGNDLKLTIEDLVKRGTPMGFLAILADTYDARKVFVPALGGPVEVLIIYYTPGVLLLVIPRSLKQLVENGMPPKRTWSPFCLSVDEILRMAMLGPETEPGYHRAPAVCRGSFYMVFNKECWY